MQKHGYLLLSDLAGRTTDTSFRMKARMIWPLPHSHSRLLLLTKFIEPKVQQIPTARQHMISLQKPTASCALIGIFYGLFWTVIYRVFLSRGITAARSDLKILDVVGHPSRGPGVGALCQLQGYPAFS